MSDIAIKVENLSKRYVLNHQRTAGEGLRHVLQQKLTAPLNWLAKKIRGQKSEASSATSAPRPPTSEEFFALRDVSFEVKRGEVVGIIGRNGAGKSTLLKILSRITEPTSGRITIEGRVASLLEVGTGFHPELTGRENIFLNGAILGMSRVEIKSKFDEIVAFAEVEKFLDTPVKRYSSGMYVRLAFAVAAHLETEILVVDEVLAVGDADFQNKCLGKMRAVSKSGKTVIFVSHNASAIQMLCSSALHLARGEVYARGEVASLLHAYLSGAGQEGAPQRPTVRIPGELSLEEYSLSPDTLESGAGASFRIAFKLEQPCRFRHLSLLIYSEFGVRAAIVDFRSHIKLDRNREGYCEFRGSIQALPLVEGTYQLGLYIVTDTYEGNHFDLAYFTVIRNRGCQGSLYPAVHRGCVELDFTVSDHDLSKIH